MERGMKMKRLPNGYGSVVFLGNNRRKPYGIRKTAGYDQNGTQKYVYVDFFNSRQDALQALAELNKVDIALNDINITFAQVFEMWWKDNKIDDRPDGTQRSYRAAFKNCAELHTLRMRKIKKRDMQNCIDNKDGKQSRLSMKTLCNHLCAYAVDNDIIIKNYATNLEVGQGEGTQNPHKVIPNDLIEKIVTYDNIDVADLFSVLLYTGARIDEILAIQSANVHIADRYMIGGNKTSAGKERRIPIADHILPIVQRRLADGGKTLFANAKGKKFSYQSIQYHLEKFNVKYKTDVQSHDCRHTLITAMNKLGVDKALYQKIVGHKGSDVTDDVYTHYTIEDMLDAVNKLDGVYWV
jgi:integrase